MRQEYETAALLIEEVTLLINKMIRIRLYTNYLSKVSTDSSAECRVESVIS